MRVAAPHDFAKRIEFSSITKIYRIAKYILVELEVGETIIFHLGMSGRLILVNKYENNKHNHCIMSLSSGYYLVLYDPRRFGFYTVFKSQDVMQVTFLQKLGKDPLSKDFSAKYLMSKFCKSNTLIKQAIMDNKIVVGIGNIYANEALFASKISPLRRAKDLGLTDCENLVKNIIIILQKAIELGGSTLKDYRDSANNIGNFQNHFLIYKKEGERCDCSSIIKNIKISNRSSYYCPNCQK
jgi:formamidopyrimidine-DNA glycosylase